MNFGLTYGDLAQQFANGLADAANAFKSQGYMLRDTGFNYQNVDAAAPSDPVSRRAGARLESKHRNQGSWPEEETIGY